MKRRTQDEWRELITQQKESGMSAHQFCLDHGINAKYFSLLKGKLKDTNPDKAISNASGFHALGALGSLGGDHTIVVKSHGATIQLPLTVDAGWLASLIKQLAQ